MPEIDEIIIELVRERKVNEASAPFLKDSKQLKELIVLVTTQPSYPLPEYGSWILLHIQRKAPYILVPHRNTLLDFFLSCSNHSVLKNIASILSQLPIDSYRDGEYLDKLFYYFQHPESKPALRVNSLYCIFPYLTLFPELKNEINLVLKQLKTQEFSPALVAAEKKYKKLFSHI